MKVRLTVGEVAQRYGVSIETVRRWLRTGSLHGFRLGGRGGWRVPAVELERFEGSQGGTGFGLEGRAEG